MKKETQKDHDNKLVELDLTIIVDIEDTLFSCFSCSNVMIHEVKAVAPNSIRFLFSGKQIDMDNFMRLFKEKINSASLQTSLKVIG